MSLDIAERALFATVPVGTTDARKQIKEGAGFRPWEAPCQFEEITLRSSIRFDCHAYASGNAQTVCANCRELTPYPNLSFKP